MLHTLPFLLPALLALEVEPGRPITASAPWAVAPEGPRSYLERLTGEAIDPRSIPPIREGNLVFDAEGLSVDMLKELDIPPSNALDHDPTPGVLYVAMDGITIKPECGMAQVANAALNCSPLVQSEVTFPPLAGGNGQAKAAMFQKLNGYYAPFNLVLSSARPPDWLPYTMAVVGGNAQQVGFEPGVCGVANVACDGGKRNHVSLSFSDSCPGSAAEIAAQETAHNWGLEHTDVKTDLMYPFIEGASSFRDQCMNISHATGNGATKCTYVHKLYCPEGAGEQQNSYGELMGVFGARVADSEKPTIVSVSPADGTQLTSGESAIVTATIKDNSNFIGVNWTWLEGLPDDLPSYRRCTNDVCDDGYGAWKPQSEPYDFLTLNKAPVGTYKFKVEAMDAYGNYVSQVITINVVEGADTGDDSAGETTNGESAGETGGAEDTSTPTSDGPDATGDVPTEGNMSGFTGASDSASDGSGGEDAGGDDGGGCRVAPTPGPAALLLLLGLGLRRRRRG